MEKRFVGYLAPHGLYILDTFSGEVHFILHQTDLLKATPVNIN